MELNGVFKKCGLLSELSTTSGAGDGETLTKLFFQEVCLEKFMNLAINNKKLWWPMGKGVMDGISI